MWSAMTDSCIHDPSIYSASLNSRLDNNDLRLNFSDSFPTLLKGI